MTGCISTAGHLQARKGGARQGELTKEAGERRANGLRTYKENGGVDKMAAGSFSAAGPREARLVLQAGKLLFLPY